MSPGYGTGRARSSGVAQKEMQRVCTIAWGSDCLYLSLFPIPTLGLGSGLISSPLTHFCGLPASHCPFKPPLLRAQAERASALSLALLWLPSTQTRRPSSSAHTEQSPPQCRPPSPPLSSSLPASTSCSTAVNSCHTAAQPGGGDGGFCSHCPLCRQGPPSPLLCSAFCRAQTVTTLDSTSSGAQSPGSPFPRSALPHPAPQPRPQPPAGAANSACPSPPTCMGSLKQEGMSPSLCRLCGPLFLGWWPTRSGSEALAQGRRHDLSIGAHMQQAGSELTWKEVGRWEKSQ